MNEPTPQNNPNLDSLTALTLRVIALETALSKIKEAPTGEVLDVIIKGLSKRLIVLEEARKRQIDINKEFFDIVKVLKNIQVLNVGKEPEKPAEKPVKRFKWF